ncbi:MAG: HlyD family efflux transporter periplasmic adaptor subunit [Kofleriaceae bacterium]|nr:HlyD family efflux transporter periplasmic adaptor subunit [Kofleriaceae bacterium]
MKKRIRWFSIVFAIVVAGMGFQASRLLGAQPPTTPRDGDIAKAARVVPPPAGQKDEREAPAPGAAVAAGNGVVEPATPETRLGAASAGVIVRIAVREGERVAAGAPIVELDRRGEAATLAAAEADIAAARAELDRIVRGSRLEEVRAVRAEADAARARSALASGIAERTARVAAAGALPGEELERAQREAEAADANARVAIAREQAVLSGSRREDIQLARARLAAAEANRARAAAAYDRLLITAPLASEVLQVRYRVGELYQPGGEPLAVLGDTSKLRVRVDIDERDINAIAVGRPTLVRANAFPGQDMRGTIVEVGRRMGRKNVRTDDPAERNDTKVLEVVVALDAPGALVVGQRVTCYILGPAGK